MPTPIHLPKGAVATIRAEYAGTKALKRAGGRGGMRGRWFRWTAPNGATVEGPTEMYLEQRLPAIVGQKVSSTWLNGFLRAHGAPCNQRHRSRARKPAQRVTPRPANDPRVYSRPLPMRVSSKKTLPPSQGNGAEPHVAVAAVVRQLPATSANIAWLADVLTTLPDTPANRAWLAHLGRHAFELWAGFQDSHGGA